MRCKRTYGFFLSFYRFSEKFVDYKLLQSFSQASIRRKSEFCSRNDFLSTFLSLSMVKFRSSCVILRLTAGYWMVGHFAMNVKDEWIKTPTTMIVINVTSSTIIIITNHVFVRLWYLCRYRAYPLNSTHIQHHRYRCESTIGIGGCFDVQLYTFRLNVRNWKRRKESISRRMNTFYSWHEWHFHLFYTVKWRTWFNEWNTWQKITNTLSTELGLAWRHIRIHVHCTHPACFFLCHRTAWLLMCVCVLLILLIK